MQSADGVIGKEELLTNLVLNGAVIKENMKMDRVVINDSGRRIDMTINAVLSGEMSNAVYDGIGIGDIIRSGANKYWSGTVRGCTVSTNVKYVDSRIYNVCDIRITRGSIDRSSAGGGERSILLNCTPGGYDLMLDENTLLFAETPTYIDAIEKTTAHEIGHSFFNIGDHDSRKNNPKHVQLPSGVKSIMNRAYSTPSSAQPIDLEYLIYYIRVLPKRAFHYNRYPTILEKYYPNWKNMY